MRKILTRVAFCPECFEKQFPKSGQKILTYGSNSESWKVVTALQDGIPGFTPHAFRIEKEITETEFLVSIICGIEGCGSFATFENIKGEKWKFLKFKEGEKEFQKFSFARWHALVHLTKKWIRIRL